MTIDMDEVDLAFLSGTPGPAWASRRPVTALADEPRARDRVVDGGDGEALARLADEWAWANLVAMLESPGVAAS